MSFSNALSGLNAAAADLNVTSNNIANVATTGFKESRAEFADVYATAYQGVSKTTAGSGVRVANIAQQFGQGSINFTDNNLDLALSGQGFFITSNDGALSYTRDGAFGVDREGFVANSSGQRLQAYPAIGDGSFNTGALSDIFLDTGENPPQATSTLTLGANLPADSQAPINPVFDSTDPLSYNHSTSSTIYDSLGQAHTATLYFRKDGTVANSWLTDLYVDGNAAGGTGTLAFNDSGALVSPADGNLSFGTLNTGTGSADLALSGNFSLSSQYGGDFSVSSLQQDGHATGRLNGIEVNDTGVVLAQYTNGESVPLGKIALANFPNPQGLQKIGNNGWAETFDSGSPIQGEAGTGSLGQVQSGALETSNVELTEQLVNMITAQRNYQANAQMISTNDSITQTIINIR